MKNVFFKEKSKDILLNLNETKGAYITEISRAINGTYAHTFNIIKDFEELGIITSKKEGRIKFVTLTEKGNQLAQLMNSFQEILILKKVKTRSKKENKPMITQGGSEEKILRYLNSIEILNEKITSNKITRVNAARMLGRYKSLLTKSRPRTEKGRYLKDKTNTLIYSAEKNISSLQ